MKNNQSLDKGDFSITNDDFPSEEKFECWDGTQRDFTISCQLFPNHGYLVRAEEKDKKGLGYEFTAYHPTSASMAQEELREKINNALSKHFITNKGIEEHSYLPIHETVEGRITYSELGLTFIVDGIALSGARFLQMFELHEGWQFKVSFVDMADEV